MKNANERIAMQVSRNSIIGNVALSLFKLAAGLFGRSAAMLSDAVHSLSDVFSTVIVMIGVKLANKEADKDHPYGHERMESVAAILLAAILFATGIGIGGQGVTALFDSGRTAPAIPGVVALVAAILSIIVKEAMYWYTRAAAKQINSGAMMADAWHHRSDALSSIGSFAGILGARMGFPWMDSLACLVICLFIVKASVDIFRDAVGKMVDKACDADTQEKICEIIQEQENVVAIDQLKTRLFGDKAYVDVEISVDGTLPLNAGHAVAHHVHDAVETAFPNVKHCMVHVNPAENGSGPATV
mgnify:CR=1 FL=1